VLTHTRHVHEPCFDVESIRAAAVDQCSIVSCFRFAMPPSVADLNNLDVELSRWSTVEAKVEALFRWPQLEDEILSLCTSLNFHDGCGDFGGLMSQATPWKFGELILKHGISPEHMLQKPNSGPLDIPLDVLPCANHGTRGLDCAKAGVSTCTGCKIVRYCSTVRFPNYDRDM
jgi:hypothetical protein